MRTKIVCLFLALIPTIYAAPYEPLMRRRDVNGDSRPDILTVTSAGYYGSHMKIYPGTATPYTFDAGGDSHFVEDWPAENVVDAVDFDGDNGADFLCRHTDGTLSIKFQVGLNPNTTFTFTETYDPAVWTPVGAGDFLGDGNPDVLFKSPDGRLMVWGLAGGTSPTVTWVGTIANIFVPSVWTPFGVADMDGDDHADILFKSTNGRICIWFMGAPAAKFTTEIPRISATVLAYTFIPANWAPTCIADFSSDGKPDILFINHANTGACVWAMDGATRLAATLVTMSGGSWMPSSEWPY